MDFKVANIPSEAVARQVYELVKKVLTKPKIFHNYKKQEELKRSEQLNVQGVQIGMIESLNFAFGGAEVVNQHQIQYKFVSTDAFDDEEQLDFTGGINLDQNSEEPQLKKQEPHEELKKEEPKQPSDEEQIVELPKRSPREEQEPQPAQPQAMPEEKQKSPPREQPREEEKEEDEVEELISGFVEVSASNVEVEVGEEEEDEGAKERTELMPESAPQESVPFLPPKTSETKKDFAHFLSQIELPKLAQAPKEATSLLNAGLLIPLFGFYLLFVAIGGLVM